MQDLETTSTKPPPGMIPVCFSLVKHTGNTGIAKTDVCLILATEYNIHTVMFIFGQKPVIFLTDTLS